MRRSSILAALLAAFLCAAGCREEKRPEPPHAPPRPVTPPASPVYEAVDVSGGGRVEGRVTFSGTKPKAEARPITKDHATCGRQAKPAQQVLVGSGGGLRNAVVTIEGIRRGKRPSAVNPVLDQQKCDYAPHVQAVAAGSTIDIVNSDDILHNVHGYLGGKETIFNLGMPTKGQRIPKQLTRPGIISLQCDAGHTWMQAYIVVTESPYFAVTDAEGRFMLEEVPAGTYKLKAWHEKLGTLEQEVTVAPSATATGGFEYK
jgi:plastocyanin